MPWAWALPPNQSEAVILEQRQRECESECDVLCCCSRDVGAVDICGWIVLAKTSPSSALNTPLCFVSIRFAAMGLQEQKQMA